VVQGDPEGCRRQALRCAELANTARTQELKQQLLVLSRNWLDMAIHLERNHAQEQLEEAALADKKPAAPSVRRPAPKAARRARDRRA
jgi:hypothetical protein